MRLFVAVLGTLLLLAVAAFCVFGFLTTFEPTDNATSFMAFRIGYTVIQFEYVKRDRVRGIMGGFLDTMLIATGHLCFISTAMKTLG